MKLTLAISTVFQNLDAALRVFEGLSERYSSDVELLIVCQNDLGYSHQTISDGVKIYYLQGKGLSKSRNYAIQKSSGKYIWFLDDDVILKDKFIDEFIAGSFSTFDIIFAKIYCSDADSPYKKYSRERLKRHDMLRVSSIEIIASRCFLSSHNVTFDECLGLGAKYPSGEENIFLLNCFDKGGRFLDVDDYCIYHPCLEEKREPKFLWSKQGYAYSKYNVAKSLGGVLGIAYAVKTLSKAMIAGVSLFHVFQFFKER